MAGSQPRSLYKRPVRVRACARRGRSAVRSFLAPARRRRSPCSAGSRCSSTGSATRPASALVLGPVPAAHTCIALDLGRAGVRHLLVGSALRETAGNQHFQHLLGYQARNLHVEVTEPGAPLAEPVSRLAPDPAGVVRFGGPPPGHPADSGNPEVVIS